MVREKGVIMNEQSLREEIVEAIGIWLSRGTTTTLANAEQVDLMLALVKSERAKERLEVLDEVVDKLPKTTKYNAYQVEDGIRAIVNIADEIRQLRKEVEGGK
jgi:hypothetical protein